MIFEGLIALIIIGIVFISDKKKKSTDGTYDQLQPVIDPQEPMTMQDVPYTAQPEPVREYPQQPPRPIVPAEPLPEHSHKRPKDIEAFIGKNIFAIIAAVLVFVGLIVFAAALIPYITDPIKFVLMCVVSLTLTGVGACLVNKKNTVLSISILACGLGTVYITLFVGNLYFKMINTVILYAALIIWILAIYYCSKYKDMVFNIIGQAGILISLILCMVPAFTEQEGAYVLYAMIFVAAAEILYDILFRDGYLINTISMLISVSILSFPVIYDIQPPFKFH
ncbi:MAG: hypothetical protein IK123_06815, partial [Lachnospiraceae bacterium]|nr:hypothetical protein [Lachnospiraceae bacterium]